MKRIDWEQELKALIYAIGEYEILEASEGSTSVRRTLFHRKQRFDIESRYFNGKHHVMISLRSLGKIMTFQFTEGRPVFICGKSCAFYCNEFLTDVRSKYKLLERAVKRHYNETNAENIFSCKLDSKNAGFL